MHIFAVELCSLTTVYKVTDAPDAPDAPIRISTWDSSVSTFLALPYQGLFLYLACVAFLNLVRSH